MPEENRNFNNGGLFGNEGTILFFIIIFLLLFTNFGCGCGCGCGCGNN